MLLGEQLPQGNLGVGVLEGEAELRGALGQDTLAFGSQCCCLAEGEARARLGTWSQQGRWRTLPNSFEKPQLVSGSGAVALMAPSISFRSRINRSKFTKSVIWIQLIHCLPSLT